MGSGTKQTTLLNGAISHNYELPDYFATSDDKEMHKNNSEPGKHPWQSVNNKRKRHKRYIEQYTTEKNQNAQVKIESFL